MAASTHNEISWVGEQISVGRSNSRYSYEVGMEVGIKDGSRRRKTPMAIRYLIGVESLPTCSHMGGYFFAEVQQVIGDCVRYLDWRIDDTHGRLDSLRTAAEANLNA